ncbi:tRNA-dihydrouridine synthase, partial [Albidovulum sp.]
GAPWRPAEIAAGLFGAPVPKVPTGQALVDYISDHYEDMLRFYGSSLGLRVARKHLGWYADEAGVDPTLRAGLMVSESPVEVLALVARAFAEAGGSAAARRAA